MAPAGATASGIFAEYQRQSQDGYGRAAGEDVVLLQNGEPVREWNPEAEGPASPLSCKKLEELAARIADVLFVTGGDPPQLATRLALMKETREGSEAYLGGLCPGAVRDRVFYELKKTFHKK